MLGRSLGSQSCLDTAAILAEVDQPGVREQLHQRIVANRFEQGTTEGNPSYTQSMSPLEVGLDEHPLRITIANAAEAAAHVRRQTGQNAEASEKIDASGQYAFSAHFVLWPGSLLDDNYRNPCCGQGDGGGEACRPTPDHKDSTTLPQLTFPAVS